MELETSASSSSSSSTSSSSMSDYFLPEIKNRKPRTLQDRIDINYYNDIEFKQRFRFTKSSLDYIVTLIKDDLSYQDNRGSPLSPRQQLMITLRYYATGCYQIVTGDLFGVAQSTVSTIVHKVSRAIAKLSKRFIKMPASDEEILQTKTEFYHKKQMPRTIGCIDGTHIPIISPGGDTAELYRNRKGWFSINVQAICDAKYKFINIVARWHGSAHDQTILNFSSIYRRFQDNQFGDSVLLGDDGYACRNWLITPYRNPCTGEQKRFNKSLTSTRAVIENCFGQWKKRFPILSRKSHIEVENLLTIIVSTTVLHNLALELNDLDEFDDLSEMHDQPIEIITTPEYSRETTVRELITQSFA